MIHNIKFRAFVYKNESVDEISQAILNLLPEAEIEAEEAEGLLEDKILILTGVVSKKRYTKDFFNKLLQSTDLEKLNNDLEQKMDEKGTGVIIDVVIDTGFDVAFARAGSASAGTKEPGIGGIWQIVMMFWNEIRPDCWYPVIQYKNLQGDSHAATFPYGGLKHTWKCGEEVKIAWNPQQPEKVYPLEGTWLRKKAIGYLIVSVILLVTSVILLSIYGTVIGL